MSSTARNIGCKSRRKGRMIHDVMEVRGLHCLLTKLFSLFICKTAERKLRSRLPKLVRYLSSISTRFLLKATGTLNVVRIGGDPEQWGPPIGGGRRRVWFMVGGIRL